MTSVAHAAAAAAIVTGAERLAGAGFAPLARKRVGLITNQTDRVGADHVADLLSSAGGPRLAAIFAPEHGFRGTAEAGASVENGRDARTGVRILSLYGASRKPTEAMLRDIDVLVFDVQDVGVRRAWTRYDGGLHPKSSYYRAGPQVRGYVARRGGYSYVWKDTINTYGDARGRYGAANSFRDPQFGRQTVAGPFDHGFFFDSGIGPHGGDAPYMH